MGIALSRIDLPDAPRHHPLAGERDQAIRALLEGGRFQPMRGDDDSSAPYSLRLGLEDGRLVINMTGTDGVPLPTLILSFSPYRRLIRDYMVMIESYENSRAQGHPTRLETIDMARRGLHDEGARLLMERLEGKISLDHPTARRFFTLICTLAPCQAGGFGCKQRPEIT